MKIKSITDVITNSSTEVFILNDSRTSSEIVNNDLKKFGFRGFVRKISREDYYSEDSYYKNHLGYVLSDEEEKNYVWIYVYSSYLKEPKEPEELDLGDKIKLKSYKIINDFGDLQKKFINDFSLLDKIKDKPNKSEVEKKFIENQERYFKYLNFLEYISKEDLITWFSTNINNFPDYKTLLDLSGIIDVSEIFGKWIDIINDGEYVEDFLGEVFNNEKFSYKLIRVD